MSEQKTIYVVFKTHFDIGFTELAKEVIERYGKKMLPDVIKTCEESQVFENSRQYVWTMSAWPLMKSLDTGNASKEDIEKARELIRRGQIAWHILPFTTHTEFCGLEEYIRGFYYSRKLSEEYGTWPVSAKMTDVPGHTWILPSLLNKAGIRFLHLGCNPGCTPPDVPRLFFWEGPDGSRVLTFYNKGSYGSALTPPEDWAFPVWLALMQTNDNSGPQKPEVIQQVINRVKLESPETNVVIGTMDDFYHALIKHSLDDIPVIRKDLADTWIHGVGSYPAEVSRIRALRPELLETEKALSLGMLLGSIPIQKVQSYKTHVDCAFEQLLLFGEHTWGLDVKTTLGYDRQYDKQDFNESRKKPANKRIEKSWDEQRRRVDLSEAALDKVTPAVMDTLAAQIDVDGARIVVFNGLGWKRNAWVDVDRYLNADGKKQLLDLECGWLLKTSYFDNKLMAYVENLPALGYKTLLVTDNEEVLKPNVRLLCDADTGVLENRWFKVVVDKDNGGIRSLWEKSCRKEWVDDAGGYRLGQYRYDVYGMEDVTGFIRKYSYRFFDWLVNDLGRMAYPEQEHILALPSSFSVDEQIGNGTASLILSTVLEDDSVNEYGNAAKIQMQVTLYENQPHIDMSFRLTGKQETPFIEAGHFVFPINLKGSGVRINKLGSVINPETDIAEDANHTLYCCENWVDISDGKKGIAIVPLDTPLFSIGDPGILKYRRNYEKSDPILFFNAFNNSWGTNFPQWIGGDLVFKYRLIPHPGDWTDGDIHRLALESITSPVLGFALQKTGNKLIPAIADLIRELDGMEVICLKVAEKRDGYIIRVREMNGARKEVKLCFTYRFESIGACDLLENNYKELGINTDCLIFKTNPFEIHTFYIKQSLTDYGY